MQLEPVIEEQQEGDARRGREEPDLSAGPVVLRRTLVAKMHIAVTAPHQQEPNGGQYARVPRLWVTGEDPTRMPGSWARTPTHDRAPIVVANARMTVRRPFGVGTWLRSSADCSGSQNRRAQPRAATACGENPFGSQLPWSHWLESRPAEGGTIVMSQAMSSGSAGDRESESRGERRDEAVVDVSVVVPCNDASHLATTLSSLAAQVAAPAFEVVIVDDSHGGVAATPIPAELDVRVVTAEGSGTAALNRNIGVAASRGPLLLFVDADDAVSENYVQAMAQALAERPLVCARVSLEKFEGIGGIRTESDFQQTGPIERDMDFLPFAGSGTLGVRRSVFDRVGGFDGTMPCYEEADLCWKIQLDGQAAPRFVPEAVLSYRMATSSRVRLRKGIRFGRMQVKLYARFRHHGMPGRSLATALREWGRLVPQAVRRVRRRPGGSGPLWNFGHALGRLAGSFERRVLYL